MTEREKLIELIQSAPRKDTIYGDIKLDKPVQTVQTIADHLLTNGVIVPPCKVGDEVYFIYEDEETKEMLIDVERITEVGSRGFWTDGTIIPCDEMNNFEPWETIGQRAFLSREDAEKALEGVE